MNLNTPTKLIVVNLALTALLKEIKGPRSVSTSRTLRTSRSSEAPCGHTIERAVRNTVAVTGQQLLDEITAELQSSDSIQALLNMPAELRPEVPPVVNDEDDDELDAED